MGNTGKWKLPAIIFTFLSVIQLHLLLFHLLGFGIFGPLLLLFNSSFLFTSVITKRQNQTKQLLGRIDIL